MQDILKLYICVVPVFFKFLPKYKVNNKFYAERPVPLTHPQFQCCNIVTSAFAFRELWYEIAGVFFLFLSSWQGGKAYECGRMLLHKS